MPSKCSRGERDAEALRRGVDHRADGAPVEHQRHRRAERAAVAVRTGEHFERMALVLDWRSIRAVIDAAAQRFGVALTPPALPSQRRTMALADAAESVGVERAMVFGAQQLLVQHRGLWGLLEARAEARIGT